MPLKECSGCNSVFASRHSAWWSRRGLRSNTPASSTRRVMMPTPLCAHFIKWASGTGCAAAGNNSFADRIPNGEELGLPAKIDEMARRPNGLFLITGPTGAGKTTTLNYMVDVINAERRCKIITIEDPIEYVHENKRAIIVQQEVLTDTHSFNRALVHGLRQDPDVIVVGEVRDHEAMETALRAAETGHLALATLHSPNVALALERI